MFTLKNISIAVLFVVVILVTYQVTATQKNDGNNNRDTEIVATNAKSVDTKEEYALLNPAVTANLGKHYIINFAPLREKLVALQSKYVARTYIYFLYLNNGVWIGLNEKDKFEAASTLKIPLAMAFMKYMEHGRIALDAAYTIDSTELNDKFGTLYKNGAGGLYTLGDLLKIMLEQSDNTAMNAVHDSLTRLGVDDPLADVYGELGWQELEPPAFDEKPNYSYINLKTLTNMFLALYNSTYLEPVNSQQLLSYLANTPFDDKLAAGLPNGVVVSHKIGIGGGTETFSDCGIVYALNRNYILCAGTNGMGEKKANEFMKELSSSVYDFVIKN
jgi:beta-lactamase class A